MTRMQISAMRAIKSIASDGLFKANLERCHKIEDRFHIVGFTHQIQREQKKQEEAIISKRIRDNPETSFWLYHPARIRQAYQS